MIAPALFWMLFLVAAIAPLRWTVYFFFAALSFGSLTVVPGSVTILPTVPLSDTPHKISLYLVLGLPVFVYIVSFSDGRYVTDEPYSDWTSRARALPDSPSVNLVLFLGHLASSRPVLESTDIFVLASYADPCSLAVCEARYAGCAIVATAVGGTPESLEHGEAGKLVEPGRPVQMTLALSALMSDPNERSSWRERAKAGSEYLTVFRLARDYDEVYRSAIERTR